MVHVTVRITSFTRVGGIEFVLFASIVSRLEHPIRELLSPWSTGTLICSPRVLVVKPFEGVFDDELLVMTAKLETDIVYKATYEESDFTEDLESVADTKNFIFVTCKISQLL